MSEEPNNPKVAVLEIAAGPKGQSMNFTAMEDLMLTMAYFQALEDSISGAKQKGTFSNPQENLCTSPCCWNKKRRRLMMQPILHTYVKWKGWNVHYQRHSGH